ncbi:MAG TPA: hypothetical protein VLJ59_11930 [Mycobacteriales bacterium]|nr:hypothetical protein [Mycobacteriales bacterium]
MPAGTVASTAKNLILALVPVRHAHHILHYRRIVDHCQHRVCKSACLMLSDHTKTVNLREDELLEPLNGWIGRLFDRDNVDRTVAALVASQSGTGVPAARGRRSISG